MKTSIDTEKKQITLQLTDEEMAKFVHGGLSELLESGRPTRSIQVNPNIMYVDPGTSKDDNSFKPEVGDPLWHQWTRIQDPIKEDYLVMPKVEDPPWGPVTISNPCARDKDIERPVPSWTNTTKDYNRTKCYED